MNVSTAGYFRSLAADKKRKDKESEADNEAVMEQFKYDMEYEIKAPKMSSPSLCQKHGIIG